MPTATSSATRANPFEDSIVTEPRLVEQTNPALNKEAFDDICRAFRNVQEQPVPRLRAEYPIFLMTSPEAGFGKSHLIGRLFQALDDDATLIYLRPFQDPETRWRNILSKIVKELDYPDRPDAIACKPGEPTQMDALVCSVLAHLLASGLENDTLESSENKDELIAELRKSPLALQKPDQTALLATTYDDMLDKLDGELQRTGVQLNASRRAWLKILFHYLKSAGNPSARALCLSWIEAQPMEREELAEIGLRLADGPDADASSVERNEMAFQRICDLCRLSAFYRPFLFCFDQTELYDRGPELAHALGNVLSRLRRESVNHLTLVTANVDTWEKQLFVHFENADQHCFQSQPVRLKGVQRKEAEEIVAARLKNVGQDPGEIASFLRKPFFNKLFEYQQDRSIRAVLKACATAWSPHTRPDMHKLLQSYVLSVKKMPKGLDFDAGMLEWAYTDVLPLASGFSLDPSWRSARGYLTLRWNNPSAHHIHLFCFEEKGNYMRWKAILGESDRYFQQARKSQDDASTLYFRTPAQKPFGSKVDQVLKANSQHIKPIQLAPDDVAALYGAHDFFADVKQGNHAGITEVQVLQFLGDYFKPNVERFYVPIPGPGPGGGPKLPPQALLDAILSSVGTGEFIPWPTMKKRLADLKFGSTREEVISACRHLAADIRVFIGPSNAVFRRCTK
ncbi:hypothetical protein DB346_12550 [Verrucomicrobia bacterium LW23]|nr:hypothetical protein DB346_12550 [Verrucomicrobia bacterium LW23]